MAERKTKIAEKIEEKTRKMLQQLPENYVLYNPPEKLRKTPEQREITKQELVQRFEEEDEFAAEMVGDLTATVLESAIRQSKKKRKK